MDFLELARRRYSVRSYKSDPVEKEKLSRILDAARLALSQAIEMEPSYPDPHCFMAIVEFPLRGDADAAMPYVEV